MKLVCLIILGFIPANLVALPVDRSTTFETALQHFSNFGASVAFMLGIENYSNQYLRDPQYISNTGGVYDNPVSVAPAMGEYMTGHKRRWTFRGVSGIVSWNIGNTEKMVVVMYYKPWSNVLHSNRLALGIFPRADLTTTLYNKMYSGEEEGFKRETSDTEGWNRPLRYRDDPDYMLWGVMAEADHGSIGIELYPKATSGLADPKYEEYVNVSLAS